MLVRRFGVSTPTAVQAKIMAALKISIYAIDAQQASLASNAYAKFGRGSQHPANLNFGDCFAYALAKAQSQPLLFKGDDFNHTDLLLAEASAYPR